MSSAIESRTAETAALSLAYEMAGSEAGVPILLLHGFPYDVREYDGVRDRVVGKGCRVIVPYLRGFGLTKYRSGEVFRSGQQAALGKDVVDLLDALEIERAVLVGFDWGTRAACVAAALWPGRVRALVLANGYAIQDISRDAVTPDAPESEHSNWYQWYFQTERGRATLSQNRDAFCRLLWTLWSPAWWFPESLYASTAKSFHNPDFVSTVIHSYRHRYRALAGDPSLEEFERRLAERPKIAPPTIVLQGENDQVNPPTTSEGQEDLFTGHYERRLLAGVGHCPPAEAPNAVAKAIEDMLATSK